MRSDVLHIDVATDQAGEKWIQLCVAVDIQALVGQVADARSKTEAEQVRQPEQMIGEASRVGVMQAEAEITALDQPQTECFYVRTEFWVYCADPLQANLKSLLSGKLHLETNRPGKNAITQQPFTHDGYL